MALNLEQTNRIHAQRMERMLGLIKGKSRWLAEETLNKQHKSLSHYPKEVQTIVVKEAEIAFMDRMILWLSQQK